MTHRTVAPSAEAYEIRLYLHSEGRKLLLATLREGTPKRTKMLFRTVERRPVARGGDILIAELFHTEQEYAQESHSIDADTVERLTGEEFLDLAERAVEVP